MTLRACKLTITVWVLLVALVSLTTGQDAAAALSADVPADQLAHLADLVSSPAAEADDPAARLQQAVDVAYDLLDSHPDAQNLSVVRQHLLAAAQGLFAANPTELNRQQLISTCEDVLAAGQHPAERLAGDIVLTRLAVADPAAIDRDRQAKLRVLVRKYADTDAEPGALIAAAALAAHLEMTDLFNEFVDRLATDHTASGQAVRFLVRVGRAAPFQAALTTLDGQALSLPDDLLGKVVLVMFWESTCPQSRRCEAPLRDLYARYRAKGLEIVAISLDGADQAGPLGTYTAENGLDWIQTYSGMGPDDPTFVHYGLDAKPAFWLVGADGDILTDNALVAVGDPSQASSLDNLEIYVRWALSLPATTDAAD